MGNSESNVRNVQEPPLLLFFKNLKPEYFPSVPQDPIGSFMEGGSCKKQFRAWLDCSDQVTDQEHVSTKFWDDSWMLWECMEAHSDYYQPILAVMKAGEEVMDKEFVSKVEVAGDQNLSEEERLNWFMNGGGCKESITAYDDCLDEAEKTNENPITKCLPVRQMWLKCMKAHSDYYQPFLAAREASTEVMWRELNALPKKL